MKRGRKPKEKKGYFYEKEEQAIVDYINSDDDAKRNAIFNTILYPALTKMIESIIRRYKLFVPDEEFEQNFSDTISYLLTKINHYKPEIIEYEEVPLENVKSKKKYIEMTFDDFLALRKNVDENSPSYIKVEVPKDYLEEDEEETEKYFNRVKKKYKAYSYCGTVCRNYLMYKCSQYSKKRKRNMSYDTMFEELNNSTKYSTEEVDNSLAENLVFKIANEIQDMIENADEYELNDNEVIVGQALVNLFRNWEQILPKGSNKLQKSKILYFLREETMMTTKEIRDNMVNFKKIYYFLKKKELR